MGCPTLTKNELRSKRRWERQNPGEVWPGYKFSLEDRKKMVNRPRDVVETTRQKISNSLKGKRHSPEHREKLRELNLGKVSPRKGCTLSNITKEKLSLAMSGKPGTRTGVRLSLETRSKMSMTRLGVSPEEWSGFAKEKNYCWKWYDSELKVRKRVRAFQGNVCTECGCTKKENHGKFLTVHHVGHDKNACCSGDNKEWVFVLLCTKHHSLVQADRKSSDEKYRKLIKEKYGGKCMYTLKEYNDLVAAGKLIDSDYGRRDGR